MQQTGLPLNSLAIEPAINRHALVVAPDIPLTDVLALMSRARSRCVLPNSNSRIDAAEENSNFDPLIHQLAVDEEVASDAAGCVLVVQEKQLVGIFTNRDIVRLTAAGTSLTNLTIADVLPKQLISLNQSTSHDIFTVISLFRQHHIRHLPIIADDGEIVGIVTHESIRKVLQPVNLLTRLRLVSNVIDILDRVAAETALRKSESQLREQATRLEQTLQKLQKTQTQLIHTGKMSSLGQLVAGIAHEINNPINFIYGNITYADQYIQDIVHLLQLYKNYYPEPVPEIVEVAEDIDLDFVNRDLPKLLGSMKLGADRIRDLVLSLRNFVRLDEAEMKYVNIHDGIESTLSILQNQLKAKPGRSEIQVIKDYAKLPSVECHAGQLNQVFMNILSNAIDALEIQHNSTAIRQLLTTSVQQINCGGLETQIERAEDFPWILISTEVLANNWVAIRIADNGNGMSEEICNRLFDPFFTTKPVGEGKGLGLSISYQIVTEKHGGQIKCISQPGQGAEFVIEIPIQQQNHSGSLAIA
ncbi:CBS sensor signal transduction histidine kinase [Crinalium epipsammum PCC 9333]|uniref:histidine kinase n=1 Tax=Crinalium epipsammum PCC 9333 TaxID=1173022 RepID=K9VX25_9CYAN|nr:ATP-binding protein [Crinalium epipsammum]AFZ12521.1 CBS sensor signal transduction histidine kinase [Crinalium epipsammum PCC 9333]